MGWPSPQGGPCARPPPSVAYPNPLQGSLSFSTTHSASIHPSAAPLPSAALPSPFVSPLLCSPPSLLPFQIYSCHRPLPDRADGDEEMAESSGRRRGDGGIEQTAARRRQNQAESTRRRRNQGEYLSEASRPPSRPACSALPIRRRQSDALKTLCASPTCLPCH